MKKITIYLFLISVLFIVQSCSTGQSAFKKGNYYDATIQAVNTLRVKSDSKKSLEVVQKSYPMALDYYRQRIKQLSNSNSPDKFLQIVETYTLMNKMADELSRCPAALAVVKPVVYFNEQLQQAEKLAVQEQFANALKLLESENIDDARLAYKRLLWVREKQPNMNDIDRQLAIAKDLATLKVVVEHLPELHSNYRINSKVFYHRLFDELEKSSGSEFVRFYKPALAEELKIRPHEVVTVQYIDFNIGTMFKGEHTNSYQLDSVIVGSYADDNGNEHNVKGTVKAEATVHEQEVKANGTLKIVIRDFQSDEIIQSRKFPGEYVWQNKWATYNGDSRAIPDDVLQLSKEKQRVPPAPQEMFLLFSDPLFFTASNYLHLRYRRS